MIVDQAHCIATGGSSNVSTLHMSAHTGTHVDSPRHFFDDGPGKPVGIGKFIGRRPIAAFGNSDHDMPMLEWTTLADGPRLGMLVHHTDGEREYDYDRQSHVGRLDKGLDEAPGRGWSLIDMRRD